MVAANPLVNLLKYIVSFFEVTHFRSGVKNPLL